MKRNKVDREKQKKDILAEYYRKEQNYKEMLKRAQLALVENPVKKDIKEEYKKVAPKPNPKKQRNKAKRNKKKSRRLIRLKNTSKGECIIIKFLTRKNIEFKREQRFPGLVNPDTQQSLRFDFYIPNKKICIEFDGAQHFMYVPELHGRNKELGNLKLRSQQYRDKIKDQYCVDNSLKLIRISYKDMDNIERILNGEL